MAIAVPATLLVLVLGSLAGYAFAWLEFPGRDWLFLIVVGLLVVPVQVALIPVSELFGTIGLFETTAGGGALPHGVRAAVRGVPAAELLRADPAGAAGGGPARRRG
ncbi:hypothetical protein GCM10020254_51930 [Streptomyces goshikiensis]